MTSEAPLRLLIDTDAGSDDAVALLVALRSSGVEIEAITTVAGNVDVDQCVRNVRYVLELCGGSALVYRGAATPVARPRRLRTPVHGDDGLGGLGLRPSGSSASARGSAAEAIANCILGRPGELTLVTLGPLTNIALALRITPEIAGLVKRVVTMAGAARGAGTVTPRAEFNVWSDPEAARAVFNSDLPLTLVDIEVSRGKSAIGPRDLATIDRIGTPAARFTAAMCRASTARERPNEVNGQAGLPDAIAMAVAIAPTIVTESGRYYVDVETSGELTTGETVVDTRGLLERAANAEIVTAVDAAAYKRLLLHALQ